MSAAATNGALEAETPQPVEDIVVEAVAGFLEREGWVVSGTKSAVTKEHGVDIEASKDGRMLLIEAKGSPRPSP